MKKYIFLLVCVFFVYNSSSQESNWFTDITIEAGLEGLRTTYVQAADVNGDDYPDILVGTSGINVGHSQTFSMYLNVEDTENPGSRKFVDFTEESGINVSRNPERPMREYDIAVLADIDNDGDADLVSAIYYHRYEYFDEDTQDRPEVFLNDGSGHFTIKLDAGLADNDYYPGLEPGQVDGVGLSFLDYDFDGILDLYIATKFVYYNSAQYGTTFFPDFLFKGNGDGSFTEVKDAGVQAIAEPLYGVNVTDFDNDGWQDVITSPYCRTGGRIMRNMGDGKFLDQALFLGYSAQNLGGDAGYDQDGNWVQQALCQWEAPTADFDNDGDMDILQCLIHGGLQVHSNGTIEGHTHIAINQGPPDYTFIDDLDRIHRKEDIGSHLGDYGGLWVDFENNGWQDIVICQGHYTAATDRGYFCIQRDDNEFYDVTEELGLMYIKDASDAQSCDFDLDGDNDIFIFHSKDTPQLRLLRNDIANNSNWISTKLIAPDDCNKDAVGARVTVYSDTLSQIRELQAGMGHFGSQGPFMVNFGIGDMNRVDSIFVRWPMMNSPITKVYNPPVNINIIIDPNGYAGYINTWEDNQPIIKFGQSVTYFGELNVGDSTDMFVEVINIGDVQLEVSDFLIEDDENNVFKLLDEITPFTLQPDETKTINVRFIPSEREFYHSLLTFNSNAVNDETKSHDLIASGHKEKALIAYDESSLYFDTTRTNSELEFTFRNPGELELVIDSILIEDSDAVVFSVVEIENAGITFPLTLASGNEQTINVKFSPKVRINYSGQLIIHSNAYKKEVSSIELFGIGDAPTPMAKFSSPFINFKTVPIGSSRDEIIEIENTGDGVLHVSDINVEENDDNVYTFPGLEFPIEIQPEDIREITIQFKPKEIISYNRAVNIISDALNEPEKQMTARGKGGEPESVEEQKFENDYLSVKVSPNPFKEKIMIEFEVKAAGIGNAEMFITGLQGFRVTNLMNKNFSSGTYNLEFDLPGLPNGVYFLVVKIKDEIISIPVVKI
ncbi:choice-of-anchor D domain-containing protein [Bacteroidota bacterium]